MKNNRKARKSIIIALLLVSLICVVSLGSKSFAKYITKQDVPATSAQVAKWGVKITVDEDDLADLFGQAYKADVKADTTADGLEVKASALCVAPGTKGDMSFTVTGTPEVANKVTFKFGDTLTEINDGTYYPLQWTLTRNGTAVVENKTLADVKTYLEGDSATTENAPGAEINDTYVLSWTWAFGTEASNHDVEDTILGNAMANVFEEGKTAEDYDLEVKFSLTITVEQIEK